MSQKKKALLRLVAFFIILSLLTWHTAYWHLSGVHTTIFSYISQGKSYLAVLYYTGLTIASSILLALFMGSFLEILGYRGAKETSGGIE